MALTRQPRLWKRRATRKSEVNNFISQAGLSNGDNNEKERLKLMSSGTCQIQKMFSRLSCQPKMESEKLSHSGGIHILSFLEAVVSNVGRVPWGEVD